MEANMTPVVILLAFIAGAVCGYLFGSKIVTRAFEIVDQIEKKVQDKVDKLKS